jgi:hypothetical protein
MIECSEEAFKNQLEQLKADYSGKISGPFINSAPNGNYFKEPFRDFAWTYKGKTILIKSWTASSGWRFYKEECLSDF